VAVPVLTIRQAYREAVQDLGPVGYWRLGEPSGTVAADELGLHDGTYANTPTLGVAGPLAGDADTAATFAAASSEYVTVPTSTAFDFALGDFSLGVWFKRASSPGASEFLIDRGTATTSGWEVFMSTGGALASRLGALTVTSAGALGNGQWHFGVVTMDRNGNGQWYIDGSPSGAAVALSSEGARDLTVSAAMEIARRSSGNYFDGSLDEVVVFNRVLTAPEISALYGIGVDAANFTAYILGKSISFSLKTLDVTLIDPPTTPALGDTVTVDAPAWAGTVTATSVSDNDIEGHTWVRITATNAAVAVANPAPFGLVDTAGDYRKLSVTRSTHGTSVEIRGTLETLRSGLTPGDVFELTSATQGFVAQEFSITEIKVGWLRDDTPLFSISFGDAVVTLSAWVNEDSGILPITETKITDGAVTTPKIATGAITADKITAGEITAEKLAATLLLASLIKTADSGARCELDASGFRAYSSAGDLLVNIPTDGSDVYVNAAVQASSLTVVGNASFRGTANELAPNSITSVASFISDPTQAPTLSQGWDSLSIPVDTAYDNGASLYFNYPFDYDAAGGAGGATKVFWMPVVATGSLHYVLELLASTRAVDRALAVPAGYAVKGVTHLGTDLYVLAYYTAGAVHRVLRYTKSTLAAGAIYTPSMPTSPTGFPSICSDGTNIFIVDRGTVGTNVKWNKYDSAMAKVGSTIDTGYDIGSGGVAAAAAGNFDFGAFRIAVVGFNLAGDNVQLFDSTGVRQANESFQASPASNGGITYGDAVGDGARFWSCGWGGISSIAKHTTWTWTTASAIYWVAYSWYDTVGTTHQSQAGPRASITMGRRKKLLVTMAPMPGAGGVDDPNSHRVYMKPNATDPGLTALKFQAQTGGNSATLTTYDSAGAADPGSNGFAAIGTAAEFKSASAGWDLKGTGLILFGGTSFPASPVTNDQYFRTDLGLWFRYNGTRWLSTELFQVDFASTSPATALAATTSNVGWTPISAAQHGGSDLWVEDVETAFFVNTGGTALGASHNWAVTVDKGVDSSATVTTIATNSLASGANGSRSVVTAVDALLNNGTTHVLMRASLTKTGTPGTVYMGVKVTYRVVAT
jgi:hypothetical protein